MAKFEALVEQWSRPYAPYTWLNRVMSRNLTCMGWEVAKKQVTCFFCGKRGHIAKVCCSRPWEVKKESTTSPRHLKPIVCFLCNEIGHKSPQCPKKKKEMVKRVTILAHMIESLAENEVMTSVNGNFSPMTQDSGAEVSIVPEEFVDSSDYAGESLKFRGVQAKCEWIEAKVAFL